MKKILLLFLVATATLSSCKKECKEWFEGEDCKTEMREKFVARFGGSLTVTVSGQVITQTTSIDIEKGNADNEIVLVVFSDRIKAELTATDKFTIPSQTVISTDGSTYSTKGSGSINDTQITINQTVNSNNQSGTATFTGSK